MASIWAELGYSLLQHLVTLSAMVKNQLTMVNYFTRTNLCSSYQYTTICSRYTLWMILMWSELREASSVWPDWVIFEKSWSQIYLQKCPKYLVTFWAVWKRPFKVKTTVTTFWTTFIFQHLVTLEATSTMSNSIRVNVCSLHDSLILLINYL